MPTFRSHFPALRAFLPVVHVDTLPQALRNVDIALSGGADGVFLIGHGMEHAILTDIFHETRAAFPGAWLGLNYLDLSAAGAMRHLPESANGLWVDNSGLGRSAYSADHGRAEEFDRLRRLHCPQALYFGAVAFKGQMQPEDLEGVTRIAATLMDVITTSGPGTGVAADREKIRRMHAAAAGHPLGLASGVSRENLHEVEDFVSAYLVASSICVPGDFYNFDAERLAALAAAIHSR